MRRIKDEKKDKNHKIENAAGRGRPDRKALSFLLCSFSARQTRSIFMMASDPEKSSNRDAIIKLTPAWQSMYRRSPFMIPSGHKERLMCKRKSPTVHGSWKYRPGGHTFPFLLFIGRHIFFIYFPFFYSPADTNKRERKGTWTQPVISSRGPVGLYFCFLFPGPQGRTDRQSRIHFIRWTCVDGIKQWLIRRMKSRPHVHHKVY